MLKMSTFDCDWNITAPYELSVFTASTSCVIAFLGIIGNLVIISVVLLDPLKKLHTPFNFFVVNLSVSDLVLGAVSLPIAAYVHVLEALKEVNNAYWYVFRGSFFISMTASILNLIALTVDRHIAITYPIQYRAYLSWGRCFLISVGIWVFALTVPFSYLTTTLFRFLMVYVNAGIFVAFITFVITYVRILKFLKSQSKTLRKKLISSSAEIDKFDLQRVHTEKKITRALLTALFLFILTYLPASVMICLLQFMKVEVEDCTMRHVLRDLLFLFIASNSCMNPFVYAIRLKPFRKSIVTLLRSRRE